MSNRDDFDQKTKENIAKRASFICSNPNCRSLTLCPSSVDENKSIFNGKAAHITAAAKGGARYDESLTTDERKSINNAIFLCSNCADMIDKNKGADFPKEILLSWKENHEQWVKESLNKPSNCLINQISQENIQADSDVTGLSANTSNPALKEILEKPLSIKQKNISSKGKVTGMDLNVDTELELKNQLNIQNDIGKVEFNPQFGSITFGKGIKDND